MGVTTVLVRTGHTRILLDPFFSRPQYGVEGATAEGIALAAELLAAAGAAELDAILVGHSHFDHAVDVGAVALKTGATVYGSQTTCLIAQAQGLPADRCVTFDGAFSVGSVAISAVRTPHWWADVSSIGGYAVYDAVPEADAVSAAPNGGMYTLILDTDEGRVVFQDSMDPITADDGSGVDFAATLSAAVGGQPTDLWVMCGDCLSDSAALEGYTDILQPANILPLHWDSTMPVVTEGLAAPFAAPDFLAAAPATLWVPEVYLARYRLKGGAVEVVSAD